MKYVFDECISHRIAEALNILEKDCEPYLRHWKRGTADLDWIPDACSKGWCVVTSDTLRRPHEREALRHHNGRVVVFATQNLRLWDQVLLIFRRWEEVEKQVSRRSPPFILRFTSRSGKAQEL